MGTQKVFVVKSGGSHYADMIHSQLLHKGAHTTSEDLDEAMSKCWCISGGDVNNNDMYNVQSDRHNTTMLGGPAQDGVNFENTINFF